MSSRPHASTVDKRFRAEIESIIDEMNTIPPPTVRIRRELRTRLHEVSLRWLDAKFIELTNRQRKGESE